MVSNNKQDEPASLPRSPLLFVPSKYPATNGSKRLSRNSLTDIIIPRTWIGQLLFPPKPRLLMPPTHNLLPFTLERNRASNCEQVAGLDRLYHSGSVLHRETSRCLFNISLSSFFNFSSLAFGSGIKWSSRVGYSPGNHLPHTHPAGLAVLTGLYRREGTGAPRSGAQPRCTLWLIVRASAHRGAHVCWRHRRRRDLKAPGQFCGSRFRKWRGRDDDPR